MLFVNSTSVVFRNIQYNGVVENKQNTDVKLKVSVVLVAVKDVIIKYKNVPTGSKIELVINKTNGDMVVEI